MEPDRKHFWTSLPGIMTGAASLLTAIVALLSLMHGSGGSQKEIPAIPPAGQVLQLEDSSKCQEIVGQWSWFTGGVTTISADGGVVWNQAGNPVAVYGQWTCMGTNPKQFRISWQVGTTDIVTLSPDKRSLGGTNQVGIQVSATRKS